MALEGHAPFACCIRETARWHVCDFVLRHSLPLCLFMSRRTRMVHGNYICPVQQAVNLKWVR